MEQRNLARDVAGSVVQAGQITVHGDFVVSAERPRTVEAVDAHVGWEDLPELPRAVESLVRAQVEMAKELPYRLPGARKPSLATVYVRQDLGAEEQVDTPRPTPMLDGRSEQIEIPTPVTRLSVRPPTRTVRQTLDRDKHVVVVGGPGQGKSTLSLRLAADAGERWIGRPAEEPPLVEPVVPLRVSASELAARLSLPFAESLAESVRAEYGALLRTAIHPTDLEHPVAGCRWLLLVDGLDEVADSSDRDRLVTVLASWATYDGSPYRVVLTSRPIDGTALAPLQRSGAARYELQPFDDDALRAFALNWFEEPETASRFIRQVEQAHLGELVAVPLLVTIAAIIHTEHGDRPLPDNQYELYEAYLRYLRTARGPITTQFDQVREPLLEHLGQVRIEEDTSLLTAARTWVAEHLSPTGDWHEDLTTFLTAAGPLSHFRHSTDVRFCTTASPNT
ncbi:hypothetical protein JOD54_003367 [Actinokineospora baliensis]|uniref:NACHT domain-containing protein n=1 Tax=Actinokineospora baliensis TaxID=547056 RepID=UPI00195B7A5C|nr:NACHT domain-containing protein [Actinokineospora baliensis]MBM7773163.1 hypothetical protein [Actinokineospora baliensis]